jgi:hypothetical protein
MRSKSTVPIPLYVHSKLHHEPQLNAHKRNYNIFDNRDVRTHVDDCILSCVGSGI